MTEKEQLEQAKLRAEVSELEIRNRFENRLGGYMPILTTIVAISGFLIGIYQIKTQQDQKIQELQVQFGQEDSLSAKEFRREYYREQLRIYLDVSKTAGAISSTTSKLERERLRSHLLELANGNLNLVQNDQVRAAVNEFITALDATTDNPGEHAHLAESARKLSNACRSSLAALWQIPQF